MNQNLAASVRARLLNLAKAEQVDFNSVLVRYALERERLDPGTLAAAIAATFARRADALPQMLPMGLSDEFGTDASRQALWAAFLKKNGLESRPLGEVVSTLREALQPALAQAAHAPSEQG